MNLDRLEHFIAIVDAGTLSAASQRVHLTQPALSRNLKLLEEELGVELFERRGRGLVLTAAGRSLVPPAKTLLEQVRRMEREVARTAERRFFDVRVGTVDSIVTFLFPKVVAPLRAAFPSLHVKLFTGRTARLLERVALDEIDLAVVAYPGPPPADNVVFVHHYELQFYGRADRFGALAEVRSEAELAPFPIVELEALPGQPTLILPDAASFGVTSSLASLKALVLEGFGVGALLDFMLAPGEMAELVAAQIPRPPDCGVYLVKAPGWKGDTQERIADTLVEALRRALGLMEGDGGGMVRGAVGQEARFRVEKDGPEKRG